MKPIDTFKLAVRILGLAFVYHGLNALPVTGAAVYAELLGGQLLSILVALILSIWPLAVAFWLLRGAPLIVQIAYPDTNATTPHETVKDSGHRVA